MNQSKSNLTAHTDIHIIANKSGRCNILAKKHPNLRFLRCKRHGQKNRVSTTVKSVMNTRYGCGGRTRTYDLRVMSPTSFQLLYSAILGRTSKVLKYCTIASILCQDVFPAIFWRTLTVFPESHKLTTPLLWLIMKKTNETEAVLCFFSPPPLPLLTF